MKDKTQLEAIDDILKKYARDVFPTKESNLPVDRRLVAQQILDLCQPQWVDVNERLPVFGDKYLTQLNNRQIHILTWVAAYWTDRYTTITNVTHWMPLPEPPGESE